MIPLTEKMPGCESLVPIDAQLESPRRTIILGVHDSLGPQPERNGETNMKLFDDQKSLSEDISSARS